MLESGSTILFIDPGKVTGVAAFSLIDVSPIDWVPTGVESFKDSGTLEDYKQEVRALLDRFRPVGGIVESYEIRHKKYAHSFKVVPCIRAIQEVFEEREGFRHGQVSASKWGITLFPSRAKAKTEYANAICRDYIDKELISNDHQADAFLMGHMLTNRQQIEEKLCKIA